MSSFVGNYVSQEKLGLQLSMRIQIKDKRKSQDVGLSAMDRAVGVALPSAQTSV